MKLVSLVALLVVYGKLQTNPECPVLTPRYSWPNMAFYAYPHDLAGPHMKGMTTITYDIDLLHEYLGPKPKILPQIWTLYGP